MFQVTVSTSGGFVGGNDALALSDADGDGVWEGNELAC